MTPREPAFTAIVSAQITSRPAASKPWATSARAPSVASPWRHSARRTRQPASARRGWSGPATVAASPAWLPAPAWSPHCATSVRAGDRSHQPRKSPSATPGTIAAQAAVANPAHQPRARWSA
jgi:hypothetical protein